MDQFIRHLKFNLGWDKIDYNDWSGEQFGKFNDIIDEIEETIKRSEYYNSIFEFYTFENYPPLFYAFFMPLLDKYMKELYIYTPYVIKEKVCLNPEIKALLQKAIKDDVPKIS